MAVGLPDIASISAAAGVNIIEQLEREREKESEKGNIWHSRRGCLFQLCSTRAAGGSSAQLIPSFPVELRTKTAPERL